MHDKQAAIPKDTIYYDGNCPICTAEMCKLSRHTGDKLDIRDIHQLNENEQVPNKQVLLDRLHLKTAEGEWLTGVDANVRAWHHTPYRNMWRMLNWPIVKIFSNLGYNLWLKWRSRRSN